MRLIMLFKHTCLNYHAYLVSALEQSHAGKVVERHWYEKNKHIFPASRWEVLSLSLSLSICAHVHITCMHVLFPQSCFTFCTVFVG